MADITMEIGNTLDVEIGATPQQLLPLIETNNSLATSNKALAESNKTLAETCQDQSATAEELTANNAELVATNKSLTDDILPTLRNGLQSKIVQPNESEQVVTADEGYIGLKEVTVKQSEYVPTIGWLGAGNTAYAGEIHAILDFSTRTSCASMFSNCTKLTGIYKIINTQNVTTMNSMFYNCPSLKELDLSGFDTSKATDISGMFLSCSSLQSLDLSGFDTSKATTMHQMFQSCSSLQSLDLSGFDTSNVTTMYQMFNSCTSLKELDLSGFDTSKVTDMRWVFQACSSLKELDLSGWDTSKVATMYQMFGSCTSLKSLDLSGWTNCQLISNMSSWNSGTPIHTYIGNHTLADVEAGLTCFEGLGRSIVTIPTTNNLRYSSMLAIGNGIYDRSEMAAGTWTLSKSAFDNMLNDDDTIPDEATVTERQTRIRAIAAAKNYTLSLS